MISDCRKVDFGFIIEPVFDEDKKFRGNKAKFTKPHIKWQQRIYDVRNNKYIPNPLFK